MARTNSLNNLIYVLFFYVLHLAKASKPSIKTVTVNPYTLTPTIPTYISPSPPCPTITISTSHTSCPPLSSSSHPIYLYPSKKISPLSPISSGLAHTYHLQTTPTSCSQNLCILDAFITVPCTCPYSVPTTTLYTPCPSACSQTCYIGHQIYHETSCSTTIDSSTTPSTTPIPIIGPPTSLTMPTGGSTACSCPYYPPYPTYCNPPCPVHTPTSTPNITTQTLPTTTPNLVTCSCPYYSPYPTNCIFPCPTHTPTTTITRDPSAPTTTNLPPSSSPPTTTTPNLVTCSCPYYPPYPTNCIFPCPIHTPTTIITVPTTITLTQSCESITVTKGDSCAEVTGGPCSSPDCIYLSTVTLNCGCGDSIGTVTNCKTRCDNGACGTEWRTVALSCPMTPTLMV
ncbi:hypothetical protein EAE96_004635 [Botrytis aclada]|nr:hypothetical protein EAE96_004635 [Botrytis aclada]